MDIAVRPLTEADLDWAADVLAATGLSARQPELRRYLALEPAGYYAAEAGGRPVGLGGYVAYERFAFVGNMAVAQDFQGRGVGRAILTRLLEEIDGRGIPETVLEATPEGERLYRKCGFVEAHWCGSAECEARVQEETKATIRCIPLERESEQGRCIYCNGASEGRVIFAQAY